MVQQLAVHTVGGVVTPAQQLLTTIVPLDSHLEIESNVSNRDVGFVSEGAKAEIKIDTFNFTRYGQRYGTVLSVSHDAITRQKPVATPQGPRAGRAERLERADWSGAGLFGACVARQDADKGRRQCRGGHGGDQHRLAQGC